MYNIDMSLEILIVISQGKRYSCTRILGLEILVYMIVPCVYAEGPDLARCADSKMVKPCVIYMLRAACCFKSIQTVLKEDYQVL